MRLDRGEHGGDLGGDIALSRHHAVLQAGPSGITIEDLGSTNGTFLNAHKLRAAEAARLADGDVIKVGATELLFKSLWLPPDGARPWG